MYTCNYRYIIVLVATVTHEKQDPRSSSRFGRTHAASPPRLVKIFSKQPLKVWQRILRWVDSGVDPPDLWIGGVNAVFLCIFRNNLITSRETVMLPLRQDKKLEENMPLTKTV